ncbi:MAG: YicC/YloC family endoribonuclease [Phycisphaerales bacterium]
MIRSMTGFGLATAEVNGAHVAVEVRSLNNKYFKSQVRLPDELQALEAEIEPALRSHLNRGSVIFTLQVSDASADAAARINVAAVQSYLKQLLEIEELTHASTRIDITAMLDLPGVIVHETSEGRLERLRPVAMELLETACAGLLAMRTREGRVLHDDLHHQRNVIADRLAIITKRSPQVVQDYQQRLKQRIAMLLSDTNTAIREEDLVREVAVYAERSDIAEEITRLQGHLEQFAEIIDSSDDEPAGRTLDFLTQEMLREANTIASKSGDAEISRMIIEIKGAIDRIREQVQNVE